MRILVLTNLYPPYYIGGYELGCKETVDKLVELGHKVIVLTSTYGVKRRMSENNIFRFFDFRVFEKCPCLKSHPIIYDGIYIGWKELINLRIFNKFIASFKPDIIYVWNMEGLLLSILFEAQKSGLPIVYKFSDYWLLEPNEEEILWYKFWEKDDLRNNGINKMAKKIIKSILAYYYRSRNVPLGFGMKNLNLKYAYFCSDDLRQKYIQSGFNFQKAEIIYNTISIDFFKFKNIRSDSDLKLLYVGQIERHKGVHTVIEAVGELVKKGFDVCLDIAGKGVDSKYLLELEDIVNSTNKKGWCNFIGRFTSNKMADIYNQHHIFIFSSIWEEPFASSILEAMACKMAIVSTATGGSKELLVDGENCLIFPAGDSNALVQKIECLIKNPDLREKLSINGEKLVREKFDFKKSIAKIEKYLIQAKEDRKD